jgi:hypothetical protein
MTAYSGGPGGTYGTGQTQINLLGSLLTKATYPHTWSIEFWTMYGTSSTTMLIGTGNFFTVAGNAIGTATIAGTYTGAAGLSSITILTSAGTFSGTISLYTFN